MSQPDPVELEANAVEKIRRRSRRLTRTYTIVLLGLAASYSGLAFTDDRTSLAFFWCLAIPFVLLALARNTLGTRLATVLWLLTAVAHALLIVSIGNASPDPWVLFAFIGVPFSECVIDVAIIGLVQLVRSVRGRRAN